MSRLAQLARRPAVGVGLIALALAAWVFFDWRRTVPADALTQARYVGRDTCAQCHAAQALSFAGSNHDRAMELATDETVLGDFNDVEFTRLGERTRFFRDGEKFMVNAEGPDGENHDYEVKWTFGVHPLQQYMVELDGGRVQVLRVSWDARKKEWFYVAPPDAPDERIEHDDPLHWTGLAQNWNTMCAECHSTDYHKNFDVATNEYHSTYFEIDVSCESCHGPGSLHVELANRRSLFWDRRVRYGLTNQLKNASNVQEVETCAPCHSRRGVIHPEFRAGDRFLDGFQPVLLEHGLYYPDGQIQDEVYEYGSFTQSKMFRKGVRCSDCHNPHSLELRYEGNQLCAQCHQPGKYDTPAHHHHTSAAPGAEETQCVTCHMPTTVYMGIDARRDHNIRIPRPDLTHTTGSPNVCNRCHTKPEETSKWAAETIVKWYGPKRPDDPDYAMALAAAQRGDADSPLLIEQLLDRPDVPDIVRATAINLLGSYATPSSERMRYEALTHASPIVRAAAVGVATPQSMARLMQEVAPKLEDPVRAVRMAAARRLVAAASELSQTQYRGALDRAIAEYKAGQSMHLDRADSHLGLANLSMNLGDVPGAVASLRGAIRAEPYRTGPRGELARVLDLVATDPELAAVVPEVGATEEEIRRLRTEEADLLARDAKLLAGDPSPHYRRGMLLYLLGDLDGARRELEEACRLGPDDYGNWMALALICEKQQRWEDAAVAIKKMAEMQPQAEDWKGVALRMRATIEAAQEMEAESAADQAPHGESESAAESRGEPEVPIERATEVPAVDPGGGKEEQE